MKTLTICLFAAAIVAVGAGGFIQIQSLQERVGMLEKAFVEQAKQKEPTEPRKVARKEPDIRPSTNPPTPAPADKTTKEPTETKAPAEISYLDQLLEL